MCGCDGSLDTLASKVSLDAERGSEGVNWKERRHHLRYTAGRVLGGRTAKCGSSMIGGHVDVIRGDGGGHHFNGLETCGSVWACPVCAVKITESRRADVKAVLEAHLASGGKAAMFTLTIPHTRFQHVLDTRKAVAAGWKAVQQGVGWKAMKSQSGFVGSIRALEVTHGANGWHPHLHVVILFSSRLTNVNLNIFSDNLFKRWSRSIARLGFGTCSEKGFSVEEIWDPEGVSKYCQKWGVAEELTKAHLKTGKAGGRSPWQILADIQEHNRPQDRALFAEYSAAFKGARQLTWTNGLRDKYLDEPEQSDEDLSQEPECADVEARRTLQINRAIWREIALRQLQGKLLILMDQEGIPGVYDLLREYGIRFAIGERQGMYGNLVPIITSH